MFAAYETTICCQQSPKVLEKIMEDAVDSYLALHPKVFPIERQSSYIVLKAQKSYRSSGELITVSIERQSFKIISKSLEESPKLVAWGKNRDNVVSLSTCFSGAVRELLYCVA